MVVVDTVGQITSVGAVLPAGSIGNCNGQIAVVLAIFYCVEVFSSCGDAV